jgi:hypothetical protein
MATSNRPQAKYPCTQAELYAICKIGWQSYAEFQTDFENHASIYTALYGTNALAEVLAAEALPDFQQRDEPSESARIQLITLADQAIQQWRGLRTHIFRSFIPSLHKPMLESAGNEYLDKAYNKNWEQVTLLLTAGSNFLTAKNAELTAGGMPAAFPLAYEAARTAFNNLYLQFMDFEQDQPEGTDEKITANNTIFEKLSSMFDDGRFIHENNPARQLRFIFAHVQELVSSNPGNSSQQATFRGVARDNATNAPLQDVLLEIGTHTTTSLADGSFELSFNISNVATLPVAISKPGYQNVISTLQILPGETIIQDLSLQRIILTTYQQTVNMGATVNLGNLPPEATGLRLTMLDGNSITAGLSTNGMNITGNPETLNTLHAPVDRSVAELGGYAQFIMAQNSNPAPATIRVDVLG